MGRRVAASRGNRGLDEGTISDKRLAQDAASRRHAFDENQRFWAFAGGSMRPAGFEYSNLRPAD